MSEQTSGTSLARPSALPDAWVGKIFDHMSGLYGSKFADLWNGSNVESVRRTWAVKLAGFADMPKAIKEALDALDSKPYPPTLPEFIALCREAGRRHAEPLAAIEYKPTPEEQQKADEMIRKAAKSITTDKRDHRAWIDALLRRQENGEKLSAVQLNAIKEAMAS